MKGQTYNLTGFWKSDAGGCYQVRQNGNEVFWAGEPGGTIRAQNVFHGAVSGNLLTGLWYDLPSNSYSGFSESISLRIESNDRMVKVSESSNYKGSVWIRSTSSCAGNAVADNDVIPGFPGKWKTTWDGGGANMEIVVSGNTATAAYNWLNGRLNGKITGNVFEGNYTNDTGSGGFQFILSADGKSFTGYWIYSGIKYSWNGVKVKGF